MPFTMRELPIGFRRPSSRPRYSARPFYLTLLVILSLAAASFLYRSSVGEAHVLKTSILEKRQTPEWPTSGGILLKREVEEVEDQCRRVHEVKDQCAFIKTNCPDHEVGLVSYLRLFYCKLDSAKPLAFTILIVWLSLLFSTIGIAASDFLCINLSTIANFLGMSESLTGVTFLAFGNGSPDVFSTFAAMGSNSGGMAVGELIGAAGFITAVVAGSMALVRPFKVARRSFVRDVGFFVVATSFSLVFLADGDLHAWECATMVAFYVFYVFTVVSWHWYLGRMRRKREREFAARAHFHIPENQELDIEEYSDDEDRVAGAGETRSLLHGPSSEDFGALESGLAWKEEDEDDETRDRYLAELRGNMRVSRAAPGERRSTINPIRPSLVGALEFRSVLSSLQKSRNIHDSPIILRRYSDDPNFASDNLSVVSSPHIIHPTRHQNLQPCRDPDANRARAVSANDATRFQLAPGFPGDRETPSIDLLVSSPPREDFNEQQQPDSAGRAQAPSNVQPDLLYVSPTSSGYPSRESSPARGMARSASPDRLVPPGAGGDFRTTDYHRADRGRHIQLETSGISPRTIPHVKRQSTAESGSMSPTSPFPAFTDIPGSVSSRAPSIRLSPPSISADSVHTHDHFADGQVDTKPWAWWPYNVLPPPEILLSTLFPTLYGWSSKSVWDRFLGAVAAPSVFLLTITLPVVEPQQPDDIPDIDSGLLSPQPINGGNAGGLMPLTPDSPMLRPETGRAEANGEALLNSGTPAQPKPGSGPPPPPQPHRHDSELPTLPPPELQQPPSSPKQWNRWLVAVQLFTAPLLITVILWTNVDDELDPRNLLIPTLSSLLFSLLCLAGLLFSTKNSRKRMPTRIRPLFAFLGFVVSIAWISTLATEVVSLLKTLGVILSISDSLLGLTVFAVGNSLGDLVADITVARLGYPVMALSACFGGPMLNILLGIGIGGLYMTLHNDSPSSSSLLSSLDSVSTLRDPYRISVSKTLLISGAVLLLTLVGLLIVVPLNGWRMDRKIGWGLVTLWCLSTIGNVVVELTTT